jgi:hypothetical protein
MNKILVLGTAAVAMAAFSACSSDDVEGLNNGSAEKTTIKAVIADQSASRTYATNEGKATWAKGDQIYTLSTKNVYTNEGDDNTTEATFTGLTSADETSQYAVYPYISSAAASLNGSTLTYTFPESYDYSASTNAPMLGTLSNGAYTFQHLAGVLRIKYASLPAGTKSVKFEANVAITGEFTTTIDAHELAQNSTATGKSVTINLDAATTEAGEKDFYIPLPTGSYEGFKVSAIDASDNVLSSYTTYKTYKLNLGDIALFTINVETSGENVKEISAAKYVDTTTEGKATTWNFGDGWGIYCEKGSTYNTSSLNSVLFIKFGKGADFYLTAPSGKKITKVTFKGSTASTSSTGYIYKIYNSGVLGTSEYLFPIKTVGLITHTFVFDAPLEKLYMRFAGDTNPCVCFYVTYKDAE